MKLYVLENCEQCYECAGESEILGIFDSENKAIVYANENENIPLYGVWEKLKDGWYCDYNNTQYYITLFELNKGVK